MVNDPVVAKYKAAVPQKSKIELQQSGAAAL